MIFDLWRPPATLSALLSPADLPFRGTPGCRCPDHPGHSRVPCKRGAWSQMNRLLLNGTLSGDACLSKNAECPDVRLHHKRARRWMLEFAQHCAPSVTTAKGLLPLTPTDPRKDTIPPSDPPRIGLINPLRSSLGPAPMDQWRNMKRVHTGTILLLWARFGAGLHHPASWSLMRDRPHIQG